MGIFDKFKGGKEKTNELSQEKALEALKSGNLKNFTEAFTTLQKLDKSNVSPELIKSLGEAVEANLFKASTAKDYDLNLTNDAKSTRNDSLEYSNHAKQLSELMRKLGASEDQIPKSGIESLTKGVEGMKDKAENVVRKSADFAEEMAKYADAIKRKKERDALSKMTSKENQPISDERYNEYLEEEKNKRQRKAL